MSGSWLSAVSRRNPWEIFGYFLCCALLPHGVLLASGKIEQLFKDPIVALASYTTPERFEQFTIANADACCSTFEELKIAGEKYLQSPTNENAYEVIGSSARQPILYGFGAGGANFISNQELAEELLGPATIAPDFIRISQYWTEAKYYQSGVSIWWEVETHRPLKIVLDARYLGGFGAPTSALPIQMNESLEDLIIAAGSKELFLKKLYNYFEDSGNLIDPIAGKRARVVEAGDATIFELPLASLHVSSDRLILFKVELLHPLLVGSNEGLFQGGGKLKDAAGFMRDQTERILNAIRKAHPNNSRSVALIPSTVKKTFQVSRLLVLDHDKDMIGRYQATFYFPSDGYAYLESIVSSIVAGSVYDNYDALLAAPDRSENMLAGFKVGSLFQVKEMEAEKSPPFRRQKSFRPLVGGVTLSGPVYYEYLNFGPSVGGLQADRLDLSPVGVNLYFVQHKDDPNTAELVLITSEFQVYPIGNVCGDAEVRVGIDINDLVKVPAPCNSEIAHSSTGTGEIVRIIYPESRTIAFSDMSAAHDVTQIGIYSAALEKPPKNKKSCQKQPALPHKIPILDKCLLEIGVDYGP